MVPVEALFGYVLLMVGFVFFGNGVTLLGKTGAKEIGVLNLAVGIFIALAAWKLHTLGQTSATALICIFSLIHIMLAGIFCLGYDTKGLGWYCLFAFVTLLWYTYYFFSLAAAVPAIADVKWFGVFTAAWALICILAFFALSLGKNLATIVGWLFIIESILTLLIPGMILLTEKWNPLGGVPG